jgi:hypothetical protein
MIEVATLEKETLMLKRKKVLPSRTRLFEMGCGEKSIIISYDNDNNPIEVFVDTPKERSCTNCVGAFTGKLLSGILRTNFDERAKKLMFEFLIKNLSEMGCEGATWDDGIYVKSCFHAIALCLQEPFVPDDDLLSFCNSMNNERVEEIDD